MPPPPIDPVTGQPVNTLPPAYDTLPKDPPTYEEIEGRTMNPMYDVQTTNSTPSNNTSLHLVAETSLTETTAVTTTTTTSSQSPNNTDSPPAYSLSESTMTHCAQSPIAHVSPVQTTTRSSDAESNSGVENASFTTTETIPPVEQPTHKVLATPPMGGVVNPSFVPSNAEVATTTVSDSQGSSSKTIDNTSVPTNSDNPIHRAPVTVTATAENGNNAQRNENSLPLPKH